MSERNLTPEEQRKFNEALDTILARQALAELNRRHGDDLEGLTLPDVNAGHMPGETEAERVTNTREEEEP